MAGIMRRHALQGVWTVVRFNWHLHMAALLMAVIFLIFAWFLTGIMALLTAVIGLGTLASIALSLVATWWAYDASGLYRMHWLHEEMIGVRSAANLHAGFDETSGLLANLFPETAWQVFDFYDPAKHTEMSIRRARKAHSPSEATIAITTECIPLAGGTLDRALLFLAAHEIREHNERVGFFREIRRGLHKDGRLIVTEHLRDAANIAVYSLGAWHFHTRREWLGTFDDAGFRIVHTFQNNPFITTFVLEPS